MGDNLQVLPVLQDRARKNPVYKSLGKGIFGNGEPVIPPPLPRGSILKDVFPSLEGRVTWRTH